MRKSAWREETFTMKLVGHNQPLDLVVKGWVNGMFGIDERKNRTWLGGNERRGKVWCITHLPTGYSVRSVLGSRKVAQNIVDSIAGGADWNFSDPNEAKTRGDAVRAAMRLWPRVFIESDEAGPPVAAQPSEGSPHDQ